MLKIRLRYALVLGVAAVLCCTRITGTSDETVIKSAKVFNPDYTPAVNVDVRLFAINDTTRIPEYQTATDNTGKYTLEAQDGMYNVLLGDDSFAAFQDSVVFKVNYSTLTNDTLGQTGVLKGMVVMEPVHDPRSTIVQIVGTNKSANVASDGTFIISGLPQGDYVLRSVTTVAEYTPTFTGFSMNPAVEDTTEVTVQLIYTGIPVVKNLKAVYDTLLNEVTLTWDTLSYFLLNDFLIYRDDGTAMASLSYPFATTGYTYTDRLGYDTRTFSYRVAVRTRTLSVGQTFETVSVTPRERLAMQLVDTGKCYLGLPYTLHAEVTGFQGSSITYAWDIDGRGSFTEGS